MAEDFVLRPTELGVAFIAPEEEVLWNKKGMKEVGTTGGCRCDGAERDEGRKGRQEKQGGQLKEGFMSKERGETGQG